MILSGLTLIIILLMGNALIKHPQMKFKEYKAENAFSMQIPKQMKVFEDLVIDFVTYGFNLDEKPLMGGYLGMHPSSIFEGESNLKLKHESGKINGLSYLAHFKTNPDRTETGEYFLLWTLSTLSIFTFGIQINLKIRLK